MVRRTLVALSSVALAFAVLVFTWQARGAENPVVNWIWFNEGDPLVDAPAETRYFRRVFTVSRPVDEATLELTADNTFAVWVNGTKVGTGDDWKRVERFDVKKHL